MIVSSILYNLRNLANFGGRATPRQFWPYAIVVFVGFQVVIFVAMLPALIASFSRIQRYAAEHPENATVVSGPGHYSIQIHGNPPGLLPDMGALVTSISIGALIIALLLALTVVRRLHDRNRSGLWALLHVPFAVFSMVQIPNMFASIESGMPDLSAFFSVLLSNAAYLAGSAVVIALLLGRSDPNENRFGTSI